MELTVSVNEYNELVTELIENMKALYAEVFTNYYHTANHSLFEDGTATQTKLREIEQYHLYKTTYGFVQNDYSYIEDELAMITDIKRYLNDQLEKFNYYQQLYLVHLGKPMDKEYVMYKSQSDCINSFLRDIFS